METSNLYLFDETPVCIETETAPPSNVQPTTTLNREQEKEPYKNPNLHWLPSLAGLWPWWPSPCSLWCACNAVTGNGSPLLWNCAYSKGRRRKDDYAEAGTKKDNSILEIQGDFFSDVTDKQLNPSQGRICNTHHISSNGMNLYKNNHSESSSNRSYRDSGIPDSDHSHSWCWRTCSFGLSLRRWW